MGWNSIVDDKDSTWRHLGKFVQIKNTRVWETQDSIGIVQPGDSSEESWTWLSQIEDNGKKKYRAEFEIWRTLKPEMEIMTETPWSRIQGQNSVYKEFLEIVGNGKLTGSGLKETIAVSDTMRISLQNRHSRIFLRGLLRSRVWKMHREPEVPEGRVPVVECLDCRARITSKELAQLHSVKIGILWSACSTSQKKDADLGKSALTHTARLTNSFARSLKEWWQKCSAKIEEYTTIRLRMSRYRAAEVLIDFVEDLTHTETNPMCKNHKKPTYIMLTFETKIHRLEWFAQVILIRATPMLQNLRIGLRKRRNGKSDVPVKQRGGRPKIS